jgi:hypothetical protein
LRERAESRRQLNMKSKVPRPKSEHRGDANQSARAEIRAFLAAFNSYPRQFAANPAITFQKHYAKSMASSRAARAHEGGSKAH